MIPYSFHCPMNKNYLMKNILKNESIWNFIRFCSSSSSSSNDSSSNHKTSNKNNSKSLNDNTNKQPNINLKFQNVLNYLERSIPLFISDNNVEEWREFNTTISQLKTDLNNNKEFAQKIDHLTATYKFDYQKFLRERHLQSRSSLLSDGSISCLLYPDLNLWNKTLPKKFLLDFLTVNILGVLDYLNNKNSENIFNYSRVPSLGHDFITRNNISIDDDDDSNAGNNHLALSYDWNFYLIDLDQYDNRYSALWQILKFLLDSGCNKSPYPIGIISTLPRNDCMYGYKFLNENDVSKLRKSKILISLEKITEPIMNTKRGQNESSQDRDERLALMARNILLANKDNIGNRWFDKSLQLIFVMNQKFDQLYAHGVCFEQSHSKIDSILELMDHSINFLTKFKPIESEMQKDIQFKKLHMFHLKSKRLAEILNQATNDFAMEKYLSICERCNLAMFQFKDYGYDWIENQVQVIPEHWIQMAVNLAMYKLTKQCRPCYQRCVMNIEPQQQQNNNNNVEETWLQCFNQEVFDYVTDPQDRKKLLIALESLRFHQNILMSSSKPGFNIEANFLVYQNLLKSGEIFKNFPDESNHLDSLLRSKSFKRLRRSTIQITTLKPNSYYDWHLISHGHPYYDHRINITTHLAKQNIHFSISMLRANDQLFRFKIDQMKYELDQCKNYILNMALNPNYEQIGKTFVQQYYAIMDDNNQRLSVANFYSETNSLMTFEGSQLMGRAKILEKFQSLTFQKIQHLITVIDSQPTFDGGVLVTVLGQLKTDDDPPHTFNQTFVLKPMGDSFFVEHDIFRLALHA